MIRSMTAFARRSIEKNSIAFTLEIHSLNHRYLDITFKLPEAWRFLESQLRERISQQIYRGKVECYLKYKLLHSSNHTWLFDETLLQTWIKAAQNIRTAFKQDITISLTDILAWPGMLQNIEHESSVVLQQDILLLLDETLQELISTRQREGLALKEHLQINLQQLTTEIAHIRKYLPLLYQQHREKILARVAALKISLDPSRLEQELLLLTHKSDVCEEIERFQIHLIEVQKVLETAGAVGRRLDFLMQELHREANTLGAKSSDGRLAHAVVNLKVWIDQMREQIQNIE